MRLYLHADVENKPMMHFPWDYHLSLMSFIYESLGDKEPELATELHQLEHAPPFSFSEFLQTGAFEVTSQGLFFTKGHITVSSTESRVIKSIKDYIPSSGNLSVGNTDVPIVGQTVEETVGVAGENIYHTLSPIAVGEYPYDTSKGQREWYHPSDPMWASRIKESVRSNMEAEVGLSDNFRFRVVDYDWVEKKVKRINSEIRIPCARASITIDTDEETSAFIQDFGVGERTGMGFGNIIIEDRMKQKYR